MHFVGSMCLMPLYVFLAFAGDHSFGMGYIYAAFSSSMEIDGCKKCWI